MVYLFLYPTKTEKMNHYIQNLVILSDKENMMIDNLSNELDGVTNLRQKKESLQTAQVGDRHVVGSEKKYKDIITSTSNYH